MEYTEAIEIIPECQLVIKNTELDAIEKIVTEDFEYTRTNIKTIIDTGMDAVENLSRIATDSESPRIFEVLATLLQINTVNNKSLMEMNKAMKDLVEGKSEANKTGKNVTNNMFVGTSTDIQKMIEEKIKIGKKK